MVPFIVLVSLLLLLFWVWTFFSLMSMPDSAFKGRNDKLIWALTLLLLSLFGAVLFHCWRLCQRTEDLAEQDIAEAFSSVVSES